MAENVTAVLGNGQTTTIIITKDPDICPQCHKHNIPKRLSCVIINPLEVDISYQCVNGECLKIFIATFTKSATTIHAFSYTSLKPIKYKDVGYSSEISDLSPQFIKIYNQANYAESKGLDEIAGVGYRKALEFLIKDHLISNKPDEKENIEKEFLGKCIKTRIEDQRIKICAERAVWIGNDETHYIKKWEDKDINDLKVLIRLTVNWIENELLTIKYLEEMDH